MIAADLKIKLEALHTESFAWAMHSCQQNRSAAEEVLQYSYLKILEGKAKYKEKAAFKTWLFSVIRYTAIDHYKQSIKPRTIPINTQSLSTSIKKESSTQSIFQQGLYQLSPNQSRILHLVFYQNLTIQVAAEVMGIQLGTARTHYKRGKANLKKWLMNAGYAIDGKFIGS